MYKGKRSCSLSTIACTSFFPSKPLGGYGDGGACFTQDAKLAQKINEIRNHGQSQRYIHTRLGLNGRFDTLQAAVILEKLPLFLEEIELRQKVAANYNKYLPTSLRKPFIKSFNQSVYAQYTIAVEDRHTVQEAFKEEGIPTAVHYPLGLYQQPIFKQMFPNQEATFPVTEKAAAEVMSLPMHPYLSLADQRRVCQVLEKVFDLIEA